jgi:hypothetical protein
MVKAILVAMGLSICTANVGAQTLNDDLRIPGAQIDNEEANLPGG